MTITLNPQDIGNGLLYVLGSGALALLVVALVRAVRILSHVEAALGPNRAALKTALADVPAVVDNVRRVSADASEMTAQLKTTVVGIASDTQQVTHAVRDGVTVLRRTATSVSESVADTAEAVRDQVEGVLTIVQVIAQIVSAFRSKAKAA